MQDSTQGTPTTQHVQYFDPQWDVSHYFGVNTVVTDDTIRSQPDHFSAERASGFGNYHVPRFNPPFHDYFVQGTVSFHAGGGYAMAGAYGSPQQQSWAIASTGNGTEGFTFPPVESDGTMEWVQQNFWGESRYAPDDIITVPSDDHRSYYRSAENPVSTVQNDEPEYGELYSRLGPVRDYLRNNR
jgi:hypothetical protein